MSAPHSCFTVELKEELEAEVLGRVVGEIMRAFKRFMSSICEDMVGNSLKEALNTVESTNKLQVFQSSAIIC